MSSPKKNALVLAKKYQFQKMNTKKGSVLTTNCNVYNEILHVLYTFRYRKADNHKYAEKIHRNSKDVNFRFESELFFPLFFHFRTENLNLCNLIVFFSAHL